MFIRVHPWLRFFFASGRTAADAAASLVVAVAFAGCTSRLYEGPLRPPEHVAVIHVGGTLVRQIDGQRRRGGTFDAAHFEVVPGTHRLTLIFELPAQHYGPTTLPAKSGVGSCELVFTAEAGKQYYLGSRPLGEPLSKRWDGSWEAWVRDPTASTESDIIARCRPAGEALAAASPTSAPIVVPPTSPAATPAPPAVAAPPKPSAPPTVAQPPMPRAAAPVVAPPLAEPVPSATPRREFPARSLIRPADQIAVGVWNLRSFGRLEKDLPAIASVIDSAFDVIALIEVSEDGGPEAYARLIDDLGPGWAGLLSDANEVDAGRSEPPERYAILYRRDRVRLCPDWPRLRRLAADDHFLHDPVTGCFEAGDLGNPELDFLLTAFHAQWANGDAMDVAVEVAYLDDLITAMRQARPGEADLLIAGDFNLEAIEVADLTRAANVAAGDGSLLNLRGDQMRDKIDDQSIRRPDHILVANIDALAERQGTASVLDVRYFATAPTNPQYYRTISDHLPLQLMLRSSGPDDD